LLGKSFVQETGAWPARELVEEYCFLLGFDPLLKEATQSAFEPRRQVVAGQIAVASRHDGGHLSLQDPVRLGGTEVSFSRLSSPQQTPSVSLGVLEGGELIEGVVETALRL